MRYFKKLELSSFKGLTSNKEKEKVGKVTDNLTKIQWKIFPLNFVVVDKTTLVLFCCQKAKKGKVFCCCPKQRKETKKAV